MKRTLYFTAVILLNLLLFAIPYSTAQTTLKMRLMTDSGDMITSNVPAIKSYFMGGDGTLTITLQEPLNFAPTDPPISLGTGVSCTLPGDGSVRASEGSTLSFNVSSADPGATLSAPVRPYNAAGGQGTFNLTTPNNGTFQWSTGVGDAGTYLAVFQAVNGAKSSQIVVMIKINPVAPVYGLVVNSTDPGATITVSPNDNSSQSSGPTPFTRTYNQNTLVTLTAPSTFNGKNFSTWTGVDSSNGYTATVTMNGNKTVTANYTTPPPQTYTLTINNSPAAGGTVTVNGQPYTGPVSGLSGNVTLLATPSTGYTFTSWTTGATVLSTSASYPFTITSNQTITANFASTNQTYTLTVTAYPVKYGTVTLSPAGGSYAPGTQVTITARPGSYRSFTGWSGDATGTITGTANPNTITMPSSNVTAGANFQ